MLRLEIWKVEKQCASNSREQAQPTAGSGAQAACTKNASEKEAVQAKESSATKNVAKNISCQREASGSKSVVLERKNEAKRQPM